LLEKPQQDKEGILGTIRSKLTDKTLTIKIGNRRLLENNHIEVPKYEASSEAATCLYLCVNEVACMVIFGVNLGDLTEHALQFTS
jgi:hypothetical protein